MGGTEFTCLCLARLLALHLPVVAAAALTARYFYRANGSLARWTSGFSLYFFAVSISIWLIPRLDYFWLQIYSMLVFVATYSVVSIVKARVRLAAPVSGKSIVTLVPLFALFAMLFHHGIFYTGFDHDPLTYQLHFAATWLQEGRALIVPTPFGDPSQAYGAALASVFYVWLMAPLGSDLLAATGGLGFFMLVCFGAMGLARELGGDRRRLLVTIVFLTLSPLLIYESVRALSDVALAGFFVASAYFFLRAARTGRSTDVAFGLMTAGMAAGCKFTGLGFLLALAPAAAVALVGARRPAGWMVGSALGLVGGGIWYLRNWILTGNPVFPIRVSVFGHELLPGLYDRGLMSNWIFHKNDWTGWLGAIKSNVSVTFLGLGLVAAGWAVVAGWRAVRGKSMPEGFPEMASGVSPRLRGAAVMLTALIPLFVDRIDWHFFPFQVFRFWIPAVVVLASVAAAWVSRRAVLAFAAAPIVAAGYVVWTPPGYSGKLFWFWSWFGVWIFVVGAWLWGYAEKRLEPGGWRPRVVAVLMALALLSCLFPAFRDYPDNRDRALAEWEYSAGWRALPKGKMTVAYTGANLPQALRGPKLDRRVIYVSTMGQVMPADHEALATFDSPPDFNTPEPVLSRLRCCPGRWTRALAAERVDYLFVMRLMRNALLNYPHNGQGWPIEDGWARSHPEIFEVIYSDQSSRIYRFKPMAEALAQMGDQCFETPADALAACVRNEKQCQTYFPLALDAMKKMGFGHGDSR